MSKLTEPGVATRMKSKRAHGQARALRKTMTPAEKKLWRALRRHPISDSHWRKQAAIGPFVVDFVCHDAKLIVELDGGVHDAPERLDRDQQRQSFLEGRGYRVLRFSNAEVVTDVGLVARTITSAPPPCGEAKRGGRGRSSTLPSQRAHPPPSPPPQGGRGAISPSDAEWVRSLLLYEDAHMLVFNKPADLAVQGGSGVEQSLEQMLAAFAKSNGKRPRLVHRLDRETSGVIVAARTKPAAAFLSEAFATREVEKTYLAIVCGGAPAPREGEIALALKKSSRKGLDIMKAAPAGDDGGQSALTRYRTLAATADAAMLELSPETGRMHQLRAHLAAIGSPIAGDGKYGGLFRIAATDIASLALHAAALDLPHPGGGRRRFEAPAPAWFMETARSLGLAAAL